MKELIRHMVISSWLFFLALGACSQAGEPLLADSGPEPDQQQSDATADQQRHDLVPPRSCPAGVPFDQSTGKLMFHVTVNGNGPYMVFYDTGAPKTYLSSKVTGGKQGVATTVESIEIGTIKLGSTAVFTADNIYPGCEGVVGNDIFAGKAVSIDYRRGRIWIDDQLDEKALLACQHTQGAPTVLPMEIGPRGHLYVPAKMQGLDGFLLVDSGASVGGISVEALELSGLENPIVEGVELKMAFGTFWAGHTVIKDMTVGSRTVTHLRMYSQPDNLLPALTFSRTLGVLPYGYLRHFLVTVDLKTNRLRLDPFVGETMDEGAQLHGYGVSLSVNATGPVTITRVIAGSPADKAAIQVGDEVIAIGSTNPSSFAPALRIKQVITQAAGTKSHFSLKRGGAAMSADLVSADLFASF